MKTPKILIVPIPDKAKRDSFRQFLKQCDRLERAGLKAYCDHTGSPAVSDPKKGVIYSWKQGLKIASRMESRRRASYQYEGTMDPVPESIDWMGILVPIAIFAAFALLVVGFVRLYNYLTPLGFE